MTESSEDGNYLVRVRAQVMTRDDSTGGWVPMGGGGLSNVSVRKRTLPTAQQDTKYEYLIYGKRISDQTIILSCVIRKDFEYNKVMPTFHHWKTGDKRFGLTFQTAADARAFDKGVRTAVEELLDGLAAQYEHLFPQSQIEDVGDDDVFMTLNLPVERGDSHSSSDSSTGKTPPQPPPPAPPPPVPANPLQESGDSGRNGGGGRGGRGQSGYSYVHEYIYPVIEENKGIGGRRDSAGSLKKRSPSTGGGIGSHGGSGTLNKGGRHKERCRHCHEPFCLEDNKRGSCRFAPDCAKSSINAVACISCARCVLYHCGSDPEGEFAANADPCECGSFSDDRCPKRWVGLTLLSLIVPCLWCYPPLRACHWCCVSCGICGGRHTPTTASS